MKNGPSIDDLAIKRLIIHSHVSLPEGKWGIVQLAMKMIDIGVAFLNPQWLALKYNTDHYGFCLRNVV